MAGYRPRKKVPEGAKAAGGITRASKREAAESELLKATSARARAVGHDRRGEAAMAARAMGEAEAHASASRKLAKKAARQNIATEAAKGSLRSVRGAASSLNRATSAYAGADGNKGNAAAGSGAEAGAPEKEAVSSLAQDAAYGAGRTAKGAASTLGGSAKERIRARRNARKALSHNKAAAGLGLGPAPAASAGAAGPKAASGARGMGPLRRSQIRARTQARRKAAFSAAGVKTGRGPWSRVGRRAASAVGAPLRILRGLSSVRRAVMGFVALLAGGSALVLTAPLLIAVAASSIAAGAAASQSSGGATSASVSAYVAQAEAYAADDSIGYSQVTRMHNPNMDCSSLVWYALVDSGCFPAGSLGGSPFTTFSMGAPLKSVGFQEVPWSQIDAADADGDGAPDGLQYGDILVNTAAHTEIYVGGGQDVGAHGDHDGANGDGDGKEVCVRAYWDDHWDFVYRLPAQASEVAANAQGVWSWLKGQGYSDAAAAAVMGNAQQESSMDPADIQNGTGPAAGLFQWESYNVSGTRWGNMAAYAASQGKDWTDTGCQLAFMQQELEQILGPGFDAFKSGNDVAALTEQFEKKFERAGIPRMERRIAYAQQYLRQFGGTA